MTEPPLPPADRDARDRAWLDAITIGDAARRHAALEGLMREYDVVFLGRLRSKRIDLHVAEDVLQGFWFELAKGRLTCPSDHVPLHWLLNVLYRRAKRYFSDEKREQGRRDHWQQWDVSTTTTPGPERAVQLQQLMAQMDMLEGADREALELVEGFHRRDWNIEDLAKWRYEQCRAQRCSCSTGEQKDCRRGTISATRKEIPRARSRLRKLLERFL